MDLFAPDDFDFDGLRGELIAAAADGVFLGTSSWKYPGWFGTVYEEQRYLGRGGKVSVRQFEQTCLREYAALFPTVCVDATYYRFPVAEELRELADQVPDGFQFTFKVTDEITINQFPMLPKFGRKGGSRNPHFLDEERFRSAFLGPCESIAEKTGMLIFEFSPFGEAERKQPQEMIAGLDGFLGALPAGWRYGVEIRNREFLTPDYFAMLASHGVGHIFNSWADMPPVAEQWELPGSVTTEGCVGARLLLKPGRKYQEAVDAFQPYDRIQEPQPEVRRTAAAILRKRRRTGTRTYLYVNNRLEGNAPRTIAAVLAMAGKGAGG